MQPPYASDAEVEFYVNRILQLAQDYEFRSYTIGTRLKLDLAEEQALVVRHNLNLRVALAVLDRMPDRDPMPRASDIIFLLDYPGHEVEAVPSAVFVYGRYLKLARNLPQSRWLCSHCRGTGRKHGTGCTHCGGTGKLYQESVEEAIAPPLVAAFCAQGNKLHATGRQDVDVRMLGRGRPFAMELLQPRRRSADLAAIERQINTSQAAVAVRELRIVDRQLVLLVDTVRADKSYRALVKCARPVGPDDLAQVEALAGVEIQQLTPQRVAHRRADKLRPRKLKSVQARLVDGSQGRFELDVLTESGTYIKELISSDGGRTRPSIAETLGASCICEELDVLDVHFDPFAPSGPAQ